MTDKNCPICKGHGFISSGADRIDDPLFGKAVPCQCNILDRVALMRKWSDLEGVEWTFNSFPGESAAKQAALKAYASGAGLWVFHSITKGNGKTGLLIAAVLQAWQDNKIALYLSVPDMLDRLRRSYADDTFNDLLETLKTTPILALDEFDEWHDKSDGDNTEGASSWAAEILFRIIDYRYLHYKGLLTLVATNKDLDRASSLDPIISRFGDSLRSHKIKMTGRDLRPLAKAVEHG